MSMHTKPRKEYDRVCKVCEAKFKAFSPKAMFCPPCRVIDRKERVARQQAERREATIKMKANPNKKKINPKWLVRGTPSSDGHTDSISNGSF